MKTIALQSATVTTPEGREINVTTRELILHCLNNPPSGGFDISTIRKRGRVETELESSYSFELALEDSDYETLKDCVQQMKWGMRSKFILDFVDMFGD
jgi:hypothetical protein